MSTSAIAFEDLDVKIEKTQILKDLSLKIPSSKVIGILGPSGAGKTTLVRSIIGLQKVKAKSFNVLGTKPGSKANRKRVGYMAQDPNIYQDLTVRENLQYYAKIFKLSFDKVDEIIKDVDLVNQTNQLAGSLSGGQLTRVSLAASMINTPDLLILDEPTVGLDPILRKRLWEKFHKFADDGHTVIVTSHVMDEAKRCDLLMLMYNGEILHFDTPENLKKAAKAKSVEESFIKLIENKK